MEGLAQLWIIVMIVSALAIIIGTVMVIYNSINKISNKKALRILLTGVITFVIGFGTCIAILANG